MNINTNYGMRNYSPAFGATGTLIRKIAGKEFRDPVVAGTTGLLKKANGVVEKAAKAQGGIEEDAGYVVHYFGKDKSGVRSVVSRINDNKIVYKDGNRTYEFTKKGKNGEKGNQLIRDIALVLEWGMGFC